MASSEACYVHDDGKYVLRDETRGPCTTDILS